MASSFHTHLETLLDSHKDQPAEVARFRELLADPRAFDRNMRRGHVTGSAFIVDAARTHCLLILHGKLGRWLQPGGHVDLRLDRSVADTAMREAREETGLASLKPAGNELLDLDIHPIPAAGDMPRHLHYDARFLIIADRGEALAPSAETRGAKWRPLAEVAASTQEESVARMARRVMARP